MAHNIEPMEIDNIESDFDNKENAFRQNLLPFASCTEKGYEELDVSELNIKLRYSNTPTSSPMSKSLTTYCADNKLSQSGNLLLNENVNLTQNVMTRSDITGKASKVLPLQLLPTQLCDKNRNTTVLRPLETTYSDNNIAITISGTQDEENVSLPSLSSSLAHTPEATTPTKDTPKQGSASPILRGLKSVLNMFRSSQSPIPPADEKTECETITTHNISPDTNNTVGYKSQTASASTPVSTHKIKEPNSSNRNSPYKETVVFNDDLEKELEWKDETTIIFSNERYPIHKLYYQKPKLTSHKNPSQYETIENEKLNETVEYMDISFSNESAIEKTITDTQFESNTTLDSDNEFVDCESTFTKSESDLLEKRTSNIIKQVPNSTLNIYEPIILKGEQQDFDVMNSNTISSLQTKPDELLPFNTEFPEELNIQQNYEIQGQNHDMQEKVIDKIDSIAINISQNNESLEIDSENLKKIQNAITIKTDTDKVLNVMNEDLTFKSEQSEIRLEKISIINLIQNVNDILVPEVTEMNDNDKVVLDISDQQKNDFPLDIFNTDKQGKSKTESNEVIKVENMVKVNTEKQSDTRSEEVTVLEDSTEKEIITHCVKAIKDEDILNEDIEKSKTECEMVIKPIKSVNILKENIVKSHAETEEVIKDKDIVIENKKEEIKTESEEVITLKDMLKVNTLEQSNTESEEIIKPDDIKDHEELDKSKTGCEMVIKPITSVNILKENIVKSHAKTEEAINHKDIVIENKKEEIKTESKEVIKLKDMLKVNTLEQSNTESEEIIKPDDIEDHEDLDKSKTGCEMVIKPITSVNILKENIVKSHAETEEVINHKDIVIENKKEEIKTESEELIKLKDILKVNTLEQSNTESEEIIKPDDIEDHEDLDKSKTGCEMVIKPITSVNILKENIFKSHAETEEVINHEDIVIENKKEEIKTESEEVIKLKAMLKINTEEQSNTESEEIIKPDEIAQDNTEKENKTNSVNVIAHEDILQENLEKSKTESEMEIEPIISEDILKEYIVKSYAETEEVINHKDIVKEKNKEETTTESEEVIENKKMLKVNSEEQSNTKSEEIIKPDDISQNNIYKESKTNSVKVIKPGDIVKVNADKKSKEKSEVVIKNEDIIEENTEKESKTEIEMTEVVTKSKDILKDKRDKEKEQLSTNEIPCNKLNEDELVLSASNSPYVSFSVEAQVTDSPETCAETFHHYKTECLPTSPPISSKGYNFNFDDINDPFATKTNMEMSPPPALRVKSDLLNKNVNTKNEFSKNRRRSQQERKKMTNMKNIKANNSFDYDAESNYVKDCQLSKQLSESHYKVKERDSRNITPGETDIIATKLSYIDSPLNKVEAIDTPHPCGEKSIISANIHEIDYEASKLKLPHTTPLYDETSATSLNISNIDSMTNKIDVQKKTTTSDKTALTNEVDPTISKIDTIDTVNVCSEITTKYDCVDNTTNQNNIYFSNIISKNEETKEAIKNESLSVSKAVANTSKSSSIQLAYNTETALETSGTKNVFNLPEIDDINFNPFTSKCKLQKSEYIGDCKIATTSNTTLNIELHVDENKVANIIKKDDNSEEKFTNTDILSLEGGHNVNINNTTSSSKDSDDKDLTVKESHTEDEETLEGPFLEAEEILNNDRILNLGADYDMIRFSDVQPPSRTDKEELFIDAQAFEFLMNQNANEVADSGKESLFLKFDPLFAGKVNSGGIVAALSDLRKKQSTPSKSSKSSCNETFDVSAVAASSTFNANHDVNLTTSEDSNDNNLTVAKPMMAVPPALHSVATPRNKVTTPTRTNRRSITFASPAIAAIDRLLSMSSNNSYINHEPIVSSQQHEADLALVQLREVLAEKEEQVLYLRIESEELKDKLSNLESQMRTLESESEDRLKKINDLTEKLTDKTKINRSMATVVEEYERTIASLISESEQDKKLHYEEKLRLISERDEQAAHLASMEVSFNDLHSKYEKSKQIILGYKANEETYTKTINDFEDNFNKMKNNYEMLKQHATSKLNHANQDLEKMNRAHESEMLKLNAMIKRKDLYITSLEETIAQKSKANEELTAICDELINKVG